MPNRSQRVVVVGAGIGGLTAAIELACKGIDVTVLEKSAAPGGKMRQVMIDGRGIDAGPTVLTMPWVFEELMHRAGTTLAEQITLARLDRLARHSFSDGSRIDLHADVARSADAIGAFAGTRERDGYLRFAAHAQAIYATLRAPFLCQPCSNPLQLMARVGLAGLPQLLKIDPFHTLHSALKRYFRDPRLVQLFGRYSTYSGSSPYQAPATLMLIAHVEQSGVYTVSGGMHALAVALETVARRLGVTFRYRAEVEHIELTGTRVSGVRLTEGERLEAQAVVLNADAAALAAGLFGARFASTRAAMPVAKRSLSAFTLSLVAEARGFPLLRHNVFFSSDYAREFRQLIDERVMPADATVYICAQDRDDTDTLAGREERLFCLINAPPTGDRVRFGPLEIEQCRHAIERQLRWAGLELSIRLPPVATTPTDFAAMFPATGGALYGQASHGWRASFQRPPARSKVPGLYLAGGSTHPGAGVPMASLSGTLAAQALLTDWTLPHRCPAQAIVGGTSTHSATTAAMR